MRFLFVLHFFLSISAANYSISGFNSSQQGFPLLDNSIISSTRSDGELTVLKQAPAKFTSGQLVMRMRFGLKNYTLYSGKINSATYNQLSAFRLPANMAYSSALKLKFYDSPDKLEAQDMAKVYFDGSLIYTENNKKLYYNQNGTWKTLETLDELPGRLEISSTPTGATVIIDGVKKGKTPYTFVMDAPTVEVEVSKSGYYSQSFSAKSTSGKMSTFAPTLQTEVSLGTVTDPLKLVDLSLSTIEDAENRLAAIVKAQATAKKKEATALKSFEANYKKLKPQDMEFEFDDEFAKRKAVYDKEKAAAKAKFVLDTVPFAKAKKEMQARIDTLDAKVYTLYLPLNTIKLGTYDKYKSEYPLSLSVKQGAFDFGFKGKVMIPRDAARKLKFSSADKGLRVEYGKRQVTVLIGGMKQKKYFKYGKLVLPFEGEEYELEGSVLLPNEIPYSNELEEYYAYINENIKLHAKLLEDLKRDLSYKIADCPYSFSTLYLISLDSINILAPQAKLEELAMELISPIAMEEFKKAQNKTLKNVQVNFKFPDRTSKKLTAEKVLLSKTLRRSKKFVIIVKVLLSSKPHKQSEVYKTPVERIGQPFSYINLLSEKNINNAFRERGLPEFLLTEVKTLVNPLLSVMQEERNGFIKNEAKRIQPYKSELEKLDEKIKNLRKSLQATIISKENN